MKKIIFVTVLILMVAVLLVPKEYNASAPVFKVWFPDNWKIERGTKVILKATAPQGDFVCQFNFIRGIGKLDENTAKQLKLGIEREMAQRFNGYKTIQEIKGGVFNGISLYTFKGTVTHKGIPMDLGFAIINANKYVVVMSTTVASASTGKYKQVGVKVLESLTFY